MLEAIPAGVRLFVDANILAYHFIAVPDLSAQALCLMERIEGGEVEGGEWRGEQVTCFEGGVTAGKQESALAG